MKKLILLLAAAFMSAVLPAQIDHHHGSARHLPNLRPAETVLFKNGPYSHKLNEYYSDDGVEYIRFCYEAKQLVAVYQEYFEDRLYDSLRYDQEDRLVRLEGFQWIDNQWLNVYYIDYSYNDRGLLASRTNYNYFEGQMQLGGDEYYTYDTLGNLILSEMYIGGSLSSTVQRIYDSDHRLTRELWSSGYFGNPLQLDEVFHYSYTGGRLASIHDSIIGEHGMEYSGVELFSYDTAGNCTLYEVRNAFGQTVDKSLYEYDYSRLLSDTWIPLTPEMLDFRLFQNKHIYTLRHWYSLDIDFVLQYICDYTYSYGGINGIGAPHEAPFRIAPNPAHDIVTVDAEEGAVVILSDLHGRQLIRTSDPSISLQHLPKGLYLISIEGRPGARLLSRY